jgi:hypothetical protein
MYWLRAGKLAEDFREGRVDEKERLKYYIATFIALNVTVQLFIYNGGGFGINDLIEAAVGIRKNILTEATMDTPERKQCL